MSCLCGQVDKRVDPEVREYSPRKPTANGTVNGKWENDNYSEVSVRLVKLFVSLCPLHEQQKTITSKQESKHKNN